MNTTRDDDNHNEEVKHEDGRRYERVSRQTAAQQGEGSSSAPRPRQRIARPRIGSHSNDEGYQQRTPYQQRPSYQPRQEGDREQRWQQNDRQHYTPRRQYNNSQEGQNYTPRRQYNNPQEGQTYTPRRQYNTPQEGQTYTPRRQYNNQQEGYRRPAGGYDQRNGYPQQQGGYRRPRPQGFNNNNNNRYNFKRRIDYKDTYLDPNKPIRLNKFLANAGACSRREADTFIEAGVVSVNGQVVTELGTKVLRTDNVMFHDQPVRLEKKVYVLLNKPKDYVTTVDDPQNRKTVMELVKDACPERIYPVGRLDRNTTGVLLLTNDGELATRLTHPHYLKKKVYHVFLDKNITSADMRKIADGVELEDGVVRVDDIAYASPTDKKQVGIEIHSGKNRIVRRLFEALGYYVTKLDRVQFCGLTKKNVRRGDWRFLTEKEVDMLRMGAFE